MYYIIETNYVGVNQEQHIDFDRVDISTVPSIGNMTKEPVIEGWCGDTDGYSVTAHGKYATLDEAESAVADKFRELRVCDDEEPDVVKAYKKGKYERLSLDETLDWIASDLENDIKSDTTDSEISKLLDIYTDAAESEHLRLHDRLQDLLEQERTNKQG